MAWERVDQQVQGSRKTCQAQPTVVSIVQYVMQEEFAETALGLTIALAIFGGIPAIAEGIQDYFDGDKRLDLQ